jgi:hypothetical protein
VPKKFESKELFKKYHEKIGLGDVPYYYKRDCGIELGLSRERGMHEAQGRKTILLDKGRAV